MTRLVRFSNNAVSRLAGNINSSATSISLTSGEGSKFPALSGGQFFMGTLIKSDGTSEVVKVTARSTDTLTVERAAEAVGGVTSSYAFSVGDRFEARLTAGALSEELDRLDNGAITEATNKSSDYTLIEDDVTKLVRVNTTSGNVTITLPEISTLGDDYDVIVAKVTGDANTVTIARTGTTDLINGASSYTVFNQWQSAWLIADRSTDTWTVISSGSGAVNTVVDSGTGDGSTANVTLSGDPASKNNVAFFVGGTYQQKATFEVSGTTLTAGAIIPDGVTWEAIWSAPLSIGVPADLSVSENKLAASAVTTAKIANSAVTSAKMAAGAAVGNIGFTPLSSSTGVTKDSATGAASMPVGTTAQRPVLPVAGMYRLNTTAGFPEYYDTAQSLWLPMAPTSFESQVLVIGGGGGGGRYRGGGGGGGGFVTSMISLAPKQSYSITIGAGGAQDVAGSSSSLSTLVTALGGGRGGVYLGNTPTSGSSGGGGGSNQAGAAGTSGQGNAGGAGSTGTYDAGGGGGGAGAIGGNHVSGSYGGAGGAGLESSFTGSSVFYSGGGGGATGNGPIGYRGAGGNGGGGAGGYNLTPGVAGTANTGGGGGGGPNSPQTGGAGGSGVVIIRYAGPQRASGGTISSAGGYTIHTFTSSGTFST